MGAAGGDCRDSAANARYGSRARAVQVVPAFDLAGNGQCAAAAIASGDGNDAARKPAHIDGIHSHIERIAGPVSPALHASGARQRAAARTAGSDRRHAIRQSRHINRGCTVERERS